MNLRRGKQLPPAVWYICRAENKLPSALARAESVMSSVSRATSESGMRRGVTDQDRMPVALYRTVGTAGKRGSKLRRAGEISLTVPGLDLATRLRVFQRALRSRIERRDALLDIVRAVNTTLEPKKIADLIVERAGTWVPAPCWVIVASDLSGQASVLADRGLAPEMGPAVYSIAGWVMQRGEDFVTADLRSDARLT